MLLRIDNSGRSVICTFDHNSETVLVKITCDIPNKRRYFSLSSDRNVIVIKFELIIFKFKTDFFHFYFLNMDISVNIQVTEMKFLTKVNSIQMEGTVSHIYYIGLSFVFIVKNR